MMKNIIMAFVVLAGISSFWVAPASACEAEGGSAIGCGIKCYDQTSFWAQAVCEMMAPNPGA